MTMLLALCACGESGGSGSDDADNGGGTADAKQLEYWNGYWYGFWMSGDATGEYEYMNSSSYDCCASIELDKNGEGTVTVWDQVLAKSNPLSIGKVKLADDATDSGTLDQTGGEFMSCNMPKNQWTVDHSDADFDGMVKIGGTAQDEDGSFNYFFILRPWGMKWDDVQDEEWLPAHYTDWYLPLIDAGETTPPDTLEFSE